MFMHSEWMFLIKVSHSQDSQLIVFCNLTIRSLLGKEESHPLKICCFIFLISPVLKHSSQKLKLEGKGKHTCLEILNG